MPANASQKPGTVAAKEEKSCIFHCDIVRELLLRLPAKSVGRFRCVSKSWLAITTDPFFLRAHTNLAPKYLFSQSLVSFLPDVMLDTKLISMRDGKLGVRPLTILDGAFCLASCDGLICISDSEGDLYILNPLLGERHRLPTDQYSIGGSIWFYFHPPSGEHLILRLGSELQVLTLGANSWRKIKSLPPPDLVRLNSTSVEVNGVMHWVARDRAGRKEAEKILAFDIGNESFSQIPLPQLELSTVWSANLVNIKGELGLWSAFKNGIMDVWVMKDYPNGDWTKKYSILWNVSYGLGNFGIGWNYNFAMCTTEAEFLFKLGSKPYFLGCNLKHGEFTEEKVDIPGVIPVGAFVYVESLLSCRSFQKGLNNPTPIDSLS